MKGLFLSAAIIILICSNVVAKPVKRSKAATVSISATTDVSKYSNAFMFVPTDKVIVAPTSMIDETNGDEDDGYDVFMTGKNFKGDVLYYDDGTVFGYYEKIKNTEMPPAVINAIETKYPGAIFTKDCETIADDRSYRDVYKTYFTYGGKHGYALVDADGKMIRSRK